MKTYVIMFEICSLYAPSYGNTFQWGITVVVCMSRVINYRLYCLYS